MTGFNYDALPTIPEPEAIEEALARIAENNVALVDLQFSDITGGMKALTIPDESGRTHLPPGLPVRWRGDGRGPRQVELDLYLAPDPSTLAVIPPRENEPRRAQLFCWVVRRDGQPFAGDPRSTLQAQLKKSAAAGFDYQVGIEMEFYLLAREQPDRLPALASDAMAPAISMSARMSSPARETKSSPPSRR